MKSVRPPWLIFALLLACAVFAFTMTADWSAQSWLDLAAYAVSLVGIAGVLAYATNRPFGAAFWGLFRWIFIGVVAAQAFVRAIEAAKGHGYSGIGTVAFILAVTVIVGWVFALQWVAMTRLAKEQ